MISHSHKFVFVWIMKTGGTSVEMALKPYGLQKYGRPGGKRRIAPPAKLKKWYKENMPGVKVGKSFISPVRHRRASELIEIPEFKKNWDNYFKFAFVRNPWDLVVSWHSFERREKSPRFSEFNKYIENREWRNRQEYSFKGCYDRIHDKDGSLMVDYIGRFENLSHDFNRICKRLGIKAQLPHKCKSEHKHYRTYYNDHTKAIVADEFAKDIKTFGYEF